MAPDKVFNGIILLCFLFLHENICYGYSLEAPCQGFFDTSPNLGSSTFSNRKVFITETRLFKYILNFNSKNWKFLDKQYDIFHNSVQNIDYGYSLEPPPRRGGSNEYPPSMFLSRNKKNNVYPCKLQFYYIKMGFMGVKII